MDFDFGVDSIIEKLRPGAKYCLSGTNFISWEHEFAPPSWEEINKLVEEGRGLYLSKGGTLN